MNQNLDTIQFERIAAAIQFMQEQFKMQPSLEQIAEAAHLSPSHFQRVFQDWAGTTPKRFLQFLSIEYAKQCLQEKKRTLFDTTFETGLSSTSRLHDLFVKIEGMTPAEYQHGGKNLSILYQFKETPFGKIIIGNTSKGICWMAFEETEAKAIENLQNHFPNAQLLQESHIFQEKAMLIFGEDWSDISEIKLHLKGTDFQLNVWKSLLKIPFGKLSTYGSMALDIQQPKAARAVGTAIGSNPIAYLIPCHRVIQQSGILGGYMWQPVRKAAIIGWEASKYNGITNE